MSIVVRCKACERTHTLEEYEEDRFCRSCGALLVLERRAPITDGGWRKLFPYEPYAPQVEFMDDVERIVGGGGVLMAEACNGFGKTASALSALLPAGRPIVYATRTHEQVRQVLDEVSTINEKSGERFNAVNLASRQHLCLNADCRGRPNREAQELCRMLRESDSCQWGSEVASIPRDLPPVMTHRELISMGRRMGVCPYYLARAASKQCTVVVVPYPYVFDGQVRASVDLELSGRILVLDEGHNLDKVGQETMSDTLTEPALDAAAEELKAVRTSTRHVRGLARHIREHTSDIPTLRPGDTLQRDLEFAIGADLPSVIERYAEAVEKVRALKLQLGDTPVSHLNGVVNFLSLVSGSSKEKYVALYRRDQRGSNTLDYRCMDPALAVRPVVEEAGGALIMSGTLSPLDLFADVLGLGGAEKRAYPPIQNSEKIRTVVDPRVTTTYRERNGEMIMNIGRSIASLLAGVDNGALIFFPQRGFMHSCLDAWGVNGVVEARRGRLYIGGKPIFIEGADARSNRETVVRYKRSAVTPGGAVLCCVFRGRNSEGSNFPGRQARGIFLVGVPYANYSDPLVRAQIGYYDRLDEGLGRRWYTMDAFRAANQSMGRGIRGRDDWCHYWLLDRRYAENIDLVSRWALGSGPEIIQADGDISRMF